MHVKYEGESNENFKNILLANLVQIGSVQLCHISALSPLCLMHALQHFTNDWIPCEKNPLAADATTHACTTCTSSMDRKAFPPRASLSGPEGPKVL
jgi:hypothetical protein